MSDLRKPRVHIKYEVETEDGLQEKELPFVVGVMGDYAGNHPGEPVKPLKERKFVTIDVDNFDQVMAKQKPGLSFRIKNELEDNDTEIPISLEFKSMEDFSPDKLIDQVPELKAIKETRDKLRDLLSKTDRSDKLEQLLEEVLQSSEKMQSLAAELSKKFPES